jgi:hypothetical protein
MQLIKKCCSCKENKELSLFYKDTTATDGLQASCKDCQKKRNSIYNKKHKSYFIKKGKEKYKKNLLENPQYNKNRYIDNKEAYLKRKDTSYRSVRGRVYSLLESAKCRSKKKNLKIDIDLDFLLEMYEKQNGRCCLTDIEFKLERNKNKERFYTPYAPSLDKIDSSKGYTRDNVRLVLVIVNLALNRFGDKVFEEISTAFLKKKGFILKVRGE